MTKRITLKDPVKITYVEDADIVSHIVDTSHHESQQRKPQNKSQALSATLQSELSDDMTSDFEQLTTGSKPVVKGEEESTVLFAFPFELAKDDMSSGRNIASSQRRKKRPRKGTNRQVSSADDLSDNSQDERLIQEYVQIAYSLINSEDIGKMIAEGANESIIEDAENDHERLFPMWIDLMRHNFNVMLVGYGSKRMILERFRQLCLRDAFHIVVDGFYPRVSITELLASIYECVFGKECVIGSDKALELLEALKKTPQGKEVFLLINSIDGPALRHGTNLRVLLELAAFHWIHIVASIDHINGWSMWTTDHMEILNWISFDVTSYRPYLDECSFLTSSADNIIKDALTLDYIRQVLESLTARPRKIFRLLVHHWHEQVIQKHQPYDGIHLFKLFEMARRRLLAANEQALRDHLAEFHDHRLLTIKGNLVSLSADSDICRILFEKLDEDGNLCDVQGTQNEECTSE